MKIRLHKLIDDVVRGKDPDDEISEMLNELQRYSSEEKFDGYIMNKEDDLEENEGLLAEADPDNEVPPGHVGDMPAYSNPYGGVDNLVIIRNLGQTAAADTILSKRGDMLRYTNEGGGIFSFEVNSQRDAAAAMLQANGIQIKSVA